MGKLTYTAMALIFAFFLTTVFLNAMYTASSDATKKQFVAYKSSDEVSQIDANITTEDSVNNMKTSAEILASDMANKVDEWQSQSFTDKLLGAFGLIATVTLDVGGLILAVFVDGFNFIAGVSDNLATSLPAEFFIFGRLGTFGLALFAVYAVFRVASAIIGRDI